MSMNAWLRKTLNALLQRRGYEIIDTKLLYDWQRSPHTQPLYTQSGLTEEMVSYLQPNNSRFKELQDRYAVFDNAVTAPLVWKDAHVRPEDILYFRGDNAYVWQLRGPNMNIMAYALTAYYVKSIDKLGLLETLREDDCCGILNFFIDNRLISRELLDSITEIYFLEKHLNISSWKDLTVLDIGAGYGRLAHRMVNALANIQQYLCTDAIAVSTFISEYYLRFRNLGDRVKVVPLDEIESTLRNGVVDIALNIHSFSECRISAIEWWVSLLAKYRVKYLMIVPNCHNNGGKSLLTNDLQDFAAVVEGNGYGLIAKEPKYGDPVVQQFAINPTCHYLFELR